jgi:tripartite motif-containing protein 71
MFRNVNCTRVLVLRLTVGLALLGWPQISSAAATWSVISFPQDVNCDTAPLALAIAPAGELYVADRCVGGQIHKRDAQGTWSVIATAGTGLGRVGNPTALAVDTVGNLYVADYDYPSSRIQKGDAQGNWSLLGMAGSNHDQVADPTALAVDGAGNLYVAGWMIDGTYGIDKREPDGNWSIIPPGDTNADRTGVPSALAVDAAGELYVASQLIFDGLGTFGIDWVHRRDAQGSWSVIATAGDAPGQVHGPTALAVDTAGTLYVADGSPFVADYANGYDGRIQMRDAQGGWSVLAAGGSAVGQVSHPSGLAVDTAGNLYVADTGNNRLLKYSPGVQ